LTSGKNPDEAGIAEERKEVPLASEVECPAVRLRDREGIGRSRQQKEPILPNDVSWQDLLFR
jgi:hypothetical protein